jgi:RNA polymerase sigma-70 factor (ECF subfamily)
VTPPGVDGEIEDCIRSEYRRLVGAVAVLTGSTSAAEDAVQEAFARAWERSRRGETFTHLPGWVATVALNHARRGHRRRQTEDRAVVRLAAAPARAGRPTEDAAIDIAVRTAVAGLAGRQREVVVLHHLLDIDVTTTAELLGVSEGTVKSALHRARAHLALALADHEEELT